MTNFQIDVKLHLQQRHDFFSLLIRPEIHKRSLSYNQQYILNRTQTLIYKGVQVVLYVKKKLIFREYVSISISYLVGFLFQLMKDYFVTIWVDKVFRYCPKWYFRGLTEKSFLSKRFYWEPSSQKPHIKNAMISFVITTKSLDERMILLWTWVLKYIHHTVWKLHNFSVT